MKLINMNQDKFLLFSVALYAIGFNLIEAYERHICQHNVQVPYTRKVNKTNLVPFEENTFNYGTRTRYREVTSVVEEVAYKYEIQSRCCPGYVGTVDNCVRLLTTPKNIESSTEVLPLAVTNMASVSGSESSTRIFVITDSSEKLTDIPSDKTEISDHSTVSPSGNTEAVTDEAIGMVETTPPQIYEIAETIATKVDWWSFPIWFLCIVVLVVFVAVLVKILVHRNARRAYIVNKKVMSTESHC